MYHKVYIITTELSKKMHTVGYIYIYPYIINDKTEVYLAEISHPKIKEMANTGFDPKSLPQELLSSAGD